MCAAGQRYFVDRLSDRLRNTLPLVAEYRCHLVGGIDQLQLGRSEVRYAQGAICGGAPDDSIARLDYQVRKRLCGAI
ncbi:hypothetical protein BST17_00275 [Mycolicibacterium bacteremicum]|uniref:Uncharacterized protein n=1 Tax=Mycolicibacterium bacteremicum TaxID=564198 RepID=A0A1W9Z3P3_MYCBA|nr:hypothetical protein BST17_00275 [Mycolicibacterium bacteremicum]